jgi:hypothetical protein
MRFFGGFCRYSPGKETTSCMQQKGPVNYRVVCRSIKAVMRMNAEDLGRKERHEKRLALFMEHLDHPEAPYRWGAAEALGKMEDPRAVEALIPLLGDPDWRVRMKTAWALGRIGDARAAPHLNRLARDESEAVRDMAKEAVQELLKRRFRETSADRE